MDFRLLLLRVVALVVVGGAVLVVVTGVRRPPRRTERSEQYQRTVGGLGTGTITDLRTGRAALDARLGSGPFDALRGMRSVGADTVAPERTGDSRHDD